MIELTRLNGNPLYINCDLIKWAEAAPDTLLTLINGEKIVVRESCGQVVERVQNHRLLLLRALLPSVPEPQSFLRAAAVASVQNPAYESADTSHESRSGHLHCAETETG
jgi:flagellar protein FlbD